MSCSINLSVTLQTQILSNVTSDFLKQMMTLRSINSVFILLILLKDAFRQQLITNGNESVNITYTLLGQLRNKTVVQFTDSPIHLQTVFNTLSARSALVEF